MSGLGKSYIGDSVYAEIRDGQLVLTTENGEGPSNTIVLEPGVYEELNRYVKRWMEAAKAEEGS